ncbi:uncharacterized protein BX664DRAFT_206244 [Halteromyces radiatus]|uniref:uncharacterized protein n=1 Tax=Halteromyces radiatus TaxID=101107 RepID=UPI00221FB3AF|nr:uncharacterized protein BX664DRAFT_206244 [Halteromyces radiatus]KAI8079979.1 hypothetical protein BX664DRAFT_206244 [Halteromyces radiatus]
MSYSDETQSQLNDAATTRSSLHLDSLEIASSQTSATTTTATTATLTGLRTGHERSTVWKYFTKVNWNDTLKTAMCNICPLPPQAPPMQPKEKINGYFNCSKGSTYLLLNHLQSTHPDVWKEKFEKKDQQTVISFMKKEVQQQRIQQLTSEMDYRQQSAF